MSARPRGPVRLALRQVLTDRVAVLTVSLVVVASSALAAAQPRALESLFTDGLRDRLAAASAPERDVVVRVHGSAPTSRAPEDPLAATQAVADDIRSSLPPRLHALTGPATYAVTVADVTQVALAPTLREPLGPTVWDVAALGALDDRVTYVDGRAPVSAEARPVPADPGTPGPGPSGLGDPAAFEASVSVAAAEEIGLAAGSTVEVGGGSSLVVVGVFEPTNPADPFWQWHGGVLDPPIDVTSNGDVYHPVAVVGSAAWPATSSLPGIDRTVLLRVPVTEVSSVRAAEAPQLLAEVRRVQVEPRGAAGTSLESFRVSSGLDQLLLTHLQAEGAATALTSVTVASLLVVCLAVLALAARLVVERRRRSLALAVARGASPVQLRVLLAAEGLVVGLVSAAVGAAVAVLAVPGASGRWGVVLPVVLGTAPAVLLPLLVRPGGLRGERRDVSSRRAGRWRAAADLLVVGLAVVAAVLVRRRGVGGAVSTAGGEVVDVPDVGVDPLLSLAPVLVALALALLVVRVYPRPLAALARVAARGRSAVPFVGAARAGRDSTTGTLPLVVMLMALSTSVFGVVVTATAQAGAEDASWAGVGADARLNGIGFLPVSVEAGREVDGVRALAGVATRTAEVTSPTRESEVTLVVTSLTDLADVQSDVPGAPRRPAEMTTVGTGPVPVTVRRGFARVGDLLTVEVGLTDLDAVVVATEPTLPGVSGTRDWVLVDDAVAETAGATAPVPGVALVALDPGVDPAAVQSDLRAAMSTGGVLLTRDAALARVRDQPLVSGTLRSFALASLVAGGLVVLAVVLTLVAGALERSRLLSRLRTLGLSARQAGGLVAWEVGPLVLTAAVVGLVAGLVVSAVTVPAIDLLAFTGGDVQPGPSGDVLGLAVVVGGFVVVSAVGVLVVLAAGRRTRLGAVLRVGDES